MKKIQFIFFITMSLIISKWAVAESRFGDLTELRDERMRGKDNQWVRPHPGPFIWNGIEREKGVFSWEATDKYIVYAQEHNQKTIATIWPHANWEQKSCKRKKARSPFGRKFTKYLSKPCSTDIVTSTFALTPPKTIYKNLEKMEEFDTYLQLFLQ